MIDMNKLRQEVADKKVEIPPVEALAKTEGATPTLQRYLDFKNATPEVKTKLLAESETDLSEEAYLSKLRMHAILRGELAEEE